MGVCGAKSTYETILLQEKNYDVILSRCREYAMRRKMDYPHKRCKEDMEVDALNENYEWEADMGGGYGEYNV